MFPTAFPQTCANGELDVTMTSIWKELHAAHGVKGHEFIYVTEYFINGRFQFQMSINSIGSGGREYM